MPGFDRTGPMGAGPMTGGRRGMCGSNINNAPNVPNENVDNTNGDANAAPMPNPARQMPMFMGRGFGRGCGRGFRRGRGRGFGAGGRY